ncbi:MAG: lytic transglycosylase domain-containing protein [Deltaproteobacteria bacterium]|nr:lytic transglycosylase domain-containing protein [Deltaproteobacteria bacterium]
MIVLLSLTLATAVVPLAPEHADVRAALVRGDVDGAAAALALDPARDAAPGLAFRVLVGRDPKAACDVVKGLLATDVADVARLYVAGCAPDAALLRVVAAGPFRHDARALQAAAVFVEANPALSGADVDGLLSGLLDAPLLVSEPEQRRAAARGLLILSTRGSPVTRSAALVRLIDELPEQAEAKAAVDVDAADPARRLRRAAVLEKMHMSDDVVALLSDRVSVDCEAALLVGKSERKLRHYAKARTALAAASKASCGDAQKRAQYLEARVAKVQGVGSAEKLLSTFAVTWGSDPLVDDVLLWLAEVRESKGDDVGATRALLEIVGKHPGGDMADEARFRLGYGAAKAKKSAAALKLLDDAVLGLRAAKFVRLDLLDRARYWRARLAVFPDVEALTPAKDLKADDVAALQAFARERSASFYGAVALRMARTLEPAHPFGEHVAGQARSLAALSVPLPSSLEKDPRFALARAALQKGFDDDAAVLIAALIGDSRDPAVVFAAGALFLQAGRPELAHQTARNAGLALLDGRPDGAALVNWTLGWPRAHTAALETAATAQKVPVPLLMGLAREESAFSHDVVSWAGAVGLCQLMPPTAKDEALSLKKPAPSVSDLVDPNLNALLGAAHLGRRLRGMSHPLLAIGAYNAGPGAVFKWLPPKGSKRPLDAFVEDIPVDETRGYIKKVTGSWVTYAILDGGYDDVVFGLWVVGR